MVHYETATPGIDKIMTSLEIILIAALTLCVCLLIWINHKIARLRQKHLILRHIFISSSDWSANKIEEVANDAVVQICDLVCQFDPSRTFEEARGEVRNNILDASKEWAAQIDALQSRLERNGLRRLGGTDLDVPPFRSDIKILK